MPKIQFVKLKYGNWYIVQRRQGANYWNWTKHVHNLRGCLNNRKFHTPRCIIAIIEVSMSYGRKVYFIGGFLMWSGFTLH